MSEDKGKTEPEGETEGKEELLFETPLEEIFNKIMGGLHLELDDIDKKEVKKQNE